jgi:hypothetical protein
MGFMLQKSNVFSKCQVGRVLRSHFMEDHYHNQFFSKKTGFVSSFLILANKFFEPKKISTRTVVGMTDCKCQN